MATYTGPADPRSETWFQEQETLAIARARVLGRTKQYFGKRATYRLLKNENFVEIEIENSRRTTPVGTATVLKSVYDARPKKRNESEVEWACAQCGITVDA
jgi:hypothetical protein